MTPNNATNKLTSGITTTGTFRVAVANTTTVSVTVSTRRSAAGDGAAYNGNQPRLIVLANPAVGIASDTVLDTHTAADGTWEQLSGTTAAVTDDGYLDFIVDCDGTTGWINVDDWTHATPVDSRGAKYWNNGLSFSYGDNQSGSGGAAVPGPGSAADPSFFASACHYFSNPVNVSSLLSSS